MKSFKYSYFPALFRQDMIDTDEDDSAYPEKLKKNIYKKNKSFNYRTKNLRPTFKFQIL